MKRQDSVGHAFGRWVVEEIADKADYVYARCACNDRCLVRWSNLRRGKSTQCRPCAAARQKTQHGMTGTPEHRAWCDMASRRHCVPEWQNFEAFLRDMGPKPEGSMLHRLDPKKPYGPGNATWMSEGRARSICAARASSKAKKAGATIGRNQQKLLRVLAAARQTMRTPVLAGLVGVSPKSAHRSMSGLMKRGIVLRVAPGEWALRDSHRARQTRDLSETLDTRDRSANRAMQADSQLC